MAGRPTAGGFYDLFSAGAPWPKAQAAIKVFILEPGFISVASESRLQGIAAFLAAHQIAIDVDLQVISRQHDEACGGLEGYAWSPDIQAVMQRLRRLGIQVSYITFDEPLWFGHYDRESLACHLPVAELISRIGKTLNGVLHAYPRVRLVDVEPVPVLTMQRDWRATYRQFRLRLEHAIGAPISALQLDVDWNNPGWRYSLRQVAAFAKQQGIQLGIVYDGTGVNHDGAQWVAAAARHFNAVEGGMGIIPEEAIFTTWFHYPRQPLPETSPNAMTHLVDLYLLPRTHIVASQSGDAVVGRLTDDAGRPVKDGPVLATIRGLDLEQALPVRTVRGTVPAAARSAVLGVRLNVECVCAGPDDVLLGDVAYRQAANGVGHVMRVPAEFQAARAGGHPWRYVSVMSAGGRRVVRIRLNPTENFMLNSRRFAVTPGTAYRLTVPMGSLTGQGVFGQATIIWFNDRGRDFSRTNVVDTGDFRLLSVARTNTQGDFRLPLGSAGVGSSVVRLQFPGSTAFRPTETHLEYRQHSAH